MISTLSTSPQLQMQLQLDYDEFILDGYKKKMMLEKCVNELSKREIGKFCI